MKLKHLSAKKLEIPFKVNFKHALANRFKTESILVSAKSFSENIGYGEGCPRSYVTNESVDTALNFIRDYKNQILGISTLQDLKSFMERNKDVIDINPAAWCAVELAMLDLLGKESQQSVEKLLQFPRLRSEFKYTAIIGDWEVNTTKLFLEKFLTMGFKNFKLKLSGDLNQDLLKINLIKHSSTDDISLRVDANKLWDGVEEAFSYLSNLEYEFFGVEEPLGKFSYRALIELSEKLGTRIILDESFRKIEDLAKLQNSIDNFILNIRISKMGGPLRSLDIAKEAVEIGFDLIVGAQVGETSILSRAALTVANNYYKNVIAQEGAFGDFLLDKDICNPSIKFGPGGILMVSEYIDSSSYGLGLNIEG
jgi:L-alanine-DL-glutamate epimerase-like enolase superfamily enzyme